MDNRKIDKRKFIKSVACLGALSLFPSFTILDFLPIKENKPKLSDEDKPWKWSKKTNPNYCIETPRGIKCLLCPNLCMIKPGKIGDCKTRVWHNNSIYSISYGNPCAVHIDPIEKKPLYHFLPQSKVFSIATAGCNLACLNCQNWNISQFSPYETRNKELFPKQVVEQCIENNCASIAYTYSDPVAFYEYTLDTAIIAKEHGIKNVLVSAGYINEKPLKEWCKYIDAANIDLKSFDNQIYMELNGGGLQPVLNTLKTLKDNGVWLEITNLIVPEWTDDFQMIEKMCVWLAKNGFQNYPLHFSRFHPTYKLTNLPATPISLLKKAKSIAQNAGLNYVYIGNVPGEDQNTYCPHCGKTIIERVGYTLLNINITNNKCKYCSGIIHGVWE